VHQSSKKELPMIYLYQILGFFLIPFIKINTWRRIVGGKELKNRYKERFGIITHSVKFSKKIIWIHAASIGEFKSVDFLINSFHKRCTLLVTTTTVSAAEYAEKYYGEKIIHQFAPLDIVFWVNKFLRQWNPSLIIWVESDLWPTTLHTIKKKKINAILINLRMSPISFNRWKKIPSFYNEIISCFSEIFAQSKMDQTRIQLLTKKKIKFIGNLKMLTTNDALLRNNSVNLVKNENTITLMITSTHSGEEKKLLPMIKNLMVEFEHLSVIIAPRHPERAGEIISICSSFDLPSHLASSALGDKKSIIVINAFGILEKYFSLSDIVFLGGSLIPVGGHNPIEPAKNKCAILTGSEIFNWQNIFEDMEENNASIKIENVAELKDQLKNLIINKNIREIMQNNAFKFAQKQFVDRDTIKNIIINKMNL
jgi:3-deoxy-D-manno-octulosonic-acid transferase